MKRRYLYIVLCLLVPFIFTACNPTDDDINFDQGLLLGKWVSGTVYYKYAVNGTGATWDTSDDVTEEEAQAFTWTLIKSELKQIHIMETGGSGVPKVYVVTELTASSLKYRDNIGNKSYSFTKVK